MRLQQYGIRGVLGLFIWLLSARFLWAIPSPELVIGSAASVGQLVALLGATLGGGAAAFRLRRGKNAIDPKTQKRVLIAFLICITLLIAAIAANIYQYQSSKNERLAHLQKTLNRPAVSQGTKINDPKLKETSLLAQIQSENGIDGASLEKLLQSNQPPLLIDVRENAESAMGTIPSASHIRFPDININDPRFRAQSVVLFCHNGNRSSEVCANLAALGIDCRFVVGGLEKWIVEGREFSDPQVRGLADLRAIPDYVGKDVLFDTSEIESLVTNDEVQFLDVRYPGEFALGHLPNAINIPLRAMPSADLAKAIDALPHNKPLVAACYDRRGCFISQVLGYEIAKTGRDFRGRYTVPWEYFIPKSVKPHIVAWLAEQNKSSWTRAIEGISKGLKWIADQTHFLVALVALALITRLFILPIALKSERDQLVLKREKAALSEIKKKYKSDAGSRAIAIKAFYKNHGLTPGKNMLALVFLPITMLGISAVSLASSGYSALGFADLSAQDSRLITPIVATLLAGIYFHLTLGGTRRSNLIIWALVTPLMALLFQSLNVAANLYVIAALGLLFIQRAYVLGKIQAVLQRISNFANLAYYRRFYMGLIPLSQPRLLQNCGNKAYHLAKMRKSKLPVPNGLVLPDATLKNYMNGSANDQQKFHRIIARHLGDGPYVVRSSGSSEDGMNESFAGVYDSVTDVHPVNLHAAITSVAASFSSEAASEYGDGGNSNILIQPMVGGEISGVMFTCDPNSHGAMLIEYVDGAGEDLVSGRVTPKIFKFGRKSLQPLGDDSPLDLSPLINLGTEIEALFSCPQDIEWTFSEGQFSIVQSRAITTISNKSDDYIAMEWAQLFKRAISKTADVGKVLFKQDEMSEVLPTPLPMSLAIMQLLWKPGYSVDIACQRLGLVYRPAQMDQSHLTTIMGRLYSDQDLKSKTAVQMTRRARRRLEMDPFAVHREHYSKFLHPFEKEVTILANIDFSKLPKLALSEKISEMIEFFATDVHSEIETINIAAQHFTDQAIDVCKSNGVDPSRALAGANASPFFPFLERQKNLNPNSDKPLFALHFGHRTTFDYEISHPRYDEQPDDLEAAYSFAISGKGLQPSDTLSAESEDLNTAINCAVAYQSLKESAKHRSLRFFAQIRRAILCLDEKMAFEGGCFFLTPTELATSLTKRQKTLTLARERRQKRQALLAENPLPADLSLSVLEASEFGAISNNGSYSDDSSRIKCVAGQPPIKGQAYVVTSSQCENGGKLDDFEEGQILVCRFVHPTFLPFVLRSSGIICELGGWLSHMAIIARERNIPMFVGSSAWQTLKSGVEIEMTQDGEISVIVTEIKADNADLNNVDGQKVHAI